MSEPGDKVNFVSVQGAYKTGENILVVYEVDPNFESKSRDWIGLFRVGWTSNRDYYTFEWADSSSGQCPEQANLKVFRAKFSGSRLPPEDGHFYQFCYVNSAGTVKGASRPFQFTKTINSDFIGDLDDIVEVKEEDSLLLLRTHHEMEVVELKKKVENLSTSNVNTEAELEKAKKKIACTLAELDEMRAEHENLKVTFEEQMLKMKARLEASEEQFEASQKEVGLLQATIVAKEEEAILFKQHIKELKNKIEEMNTQLYDLEKQKSDTDKHIQSMADELIIMTDENKRLQENEQLFRDKCNQLEQENRAIFEKTESLNSHAAYRERKITELENEVEALKAQIVELEEEMNELATQLENKDEEKKKLMEMMKVKEQEANVAQSNLCEVLGNVNEPRDILGRSTSTEMVDKSALEALQMAYADVEKRCNIERKSVLRLKNKVAELEVRIQQCRTEYEVILTENIALKKSTKQNRSPSVQEKSVLDSDAGIKLLQREYERLELELQEFQQKHDTRMAEKSNRISELEKEIEKHKDEISGRRVQEDAMKKNMESLMRKNDQISAANAQLRERVEEMKRNRHPHQDMLVTPPAYNPTFQPVNPNYYVPPPNGGVHINQRPHTHRVPSKQCPICQAEFPRSMDQKDFETHVQSHFPN